MSSVNVHCASAPNFIYTIFSSKLRWNAELFQNIFTKKFSSFLVLCYQAITKRRFLIKNIPKNENENENGSDSTNFTKSIRFLEFLIFSSKILASNDSIQWALLSRLARKQNQLSRNGSWFSLCTTDCVQIFYGVYRVNSQNYHEKTFLNSFLFYIFFTYFWLPIIQSAYKYFCFLIYKSHFTHIKSITLIYKSYKYSSLGIETDTLDWNRRVCKF